MNKKEFMMFFLSFLLAIECNSTVNALHMDNIPFSPPPDAITTSPIIQDQESGTEQDWMPEPDYFPESTPESDWVDPLPSPGESVIPIPDVIVPPIPEMTPEPETEIVPEEITTIPENLYELDTSPNSNKTGAVQITIDLTKNLPDDVLEPVILIRLSSSSHALNSKYTDPNELQIILNKENSYSHFTNLPIGAYYYLFGGDGDGGSIDFYLDCPSFFIVTENNTTIQNLTIKSQEAQKKDEAANGISSNSSFGKVEFSHIAEISSEIVEISLVNTSGDIYKVVLNSINGHVSEISLPADVYTISKVVSNKNPDLTIAEERFEVKDNVSRMIQTLNEKEEEDEIQEVTKVEVKKSKSVVEKLLPFCILSLLCMLSILGYAYHLNKNPISRKK